MPRPFHRPAETAHSSNFEIVFDHYDPRDERRRESLLSLGNGVLQCRASAAQQGRGDDHYPGLYRAGCYARLVGEVEGEAVSTDSLANLPSWLPVAFRLDGEADWFSLDRVEMERYRQCLDMKAGLLTREVTFRDSRGRLTELVEERFVSMDLVHVGSSRMTLRPLDWSGRIEIMAGLDAGVRNALAAEEGGYEPQALEHVSLLQDAGSGCLVASARTLGTKVDLCVVARSRVTVNAAPVTPLPRLEEDEARIAQVWSVDVSCGAVVEVEKLGVTHTSRDHAIPALSEGAVRAACDAPDHATLRARHVQAWAHLWKRCWIEVEDENLARAAALHAFHLLQTASPHAAISDAGLPSRGWQEAYHGQIFWDEALLLPFLSLHLPEVVRSALIHRHRRLGAARARAARHGLRGALYPWRSATLGHEETPEFQQNPKSGRWTRDDTRLQFHVGSAIAHNIWRYFLATRDVDFMMGYGTEMMVEIARMWMSLAQPHPERADRFTIRGVVGPDEFHVRYPRADRPGLHDDSYTNIMAAWTLRHAAKALDRLPAHHRAGLQARLEIGADEVAQWQDVATRLHLVTDDEGRFLQFDGYERLEPFDLEAHEREHPGERLDWFIGAQGGDINALQVQKQATFAMLLHLLPIDEVSGLLADMGHAATPDVLRRTVEADLSRTSHDSSLSNLIYAGALARLAPELSWDMYRDALHPDEKAGHSGTEKGVHLGAMGATLDILQRTYLGIRPEEAALVVDPAPHPHHGRLRCHVLFRSNAVSVELEGGQIRVCADPGNHGSVPLRVAGHDCRLEPGEHYLTQIDKADEGECDAADQGPAVRS